MMTRRDLYLYGLLLTIFLCVLSRGAHAQAVMTYLPESTHYQGQLNFNYTQRDSSGRVGRIEFAVYDTETYEHEFVGDFADDLDWWSESPASNSRYIYAYQIFVDEAIEAIDYFGLVDIGENAIVQDSSTNNKWPIEAVDDLSGNGIAPETSYFPPPSEEFDRMAVWEFGEGNLIAGEHSWFLVIGSDHDWTAGRYTFDNTLNEMLPIMNPEPATIVLLGIGGLLAITKRKRT